MTTHTEDQGAAQAASDATQRGISRRTALKAAVATGAAIYAVPAIDTLTAHAATGVSKFQNNNVFVTTCGTTTYTNANGKTATINIHPTTGCQSNTITINDPDVAIGSGTANYSAESGTTNDQFEVTMNGKNINIFITNVGTSCDSPVSGQTIQFSGDYNVPATPITAGQVILTSCTA